MEYRVGTGYDAHKLVQGRPLVLGGVNIPHEKGLLGHSDADALCHAITDAILGAANLGDIGQHFPDSELKWKGADSLMLLKESAMLADEKGWQVVNVDATLVCQSPRLADHMPAMAANIAKALRIDVDSVSVKAKTTEGMGFEGREEGISAQAVVLLKKS
jgi:2-C-methyl-D-erythritol 2,4-cyclodiphosphate synthase